MAEQKVQGPASYFPSIERTYGRPIAEWKAMMRATGTTSHRDLVAWLKTEHGMGHGHANALTAHLLAEGTPRVSRSDAVAALFPAPKAHWLPVYDALAAYALGLGEVTVLPKKTLVGFGTGRRQFLMLAPSAPARFDVGLRLDDTPTSERLEPAGSWNTMMTARVRLGSAAEADAELRHWISQAFEQAR
jgi:hypothetical protein